MPGICHFQAQWMRIKAYEDWLQPGKHSTDAYCVFCMKEFSIKARRKANVDYHHAGKQDLRSVEAKKQSLSQVR